MDRKRTMQDPATLVRLALVAALLVGAAAPVPGQAAGSLANWNLSGFIDSTSPRPVNSTAANVSASSLSRSAAVAPTGQINAFAGGNFPTSSLDAGKYFRVTIQPAYEHQITYSTVEFDVLYNTLLFGSFVTWQVRSSATGFGTALDSGVLISAGSDPTGVIANVAAVGTRDDPVEFRIYFYNNFGLLPQTRGLLHGPLGGLTVRGSASLLPKRYPGTEEDLVTEFSISGAPVEVANSRLPRQLQPGDDIVITHTSPGGTFVTTAPVTAFVSTQPAGTTFPTPYPALHIQSSSFGLVYGPTVFGGPALLPSAGISYGFTYPGGLGSLVALVQCVVTDATAANGIFASTDGLEICFN